MYTNSGWIEISCGVNLVVRSRSVAASFLHHNCAYLTGGHHGLGRAYHMIKNSFHWRGLYRSLQLYLVQCVDCETGKGRESPGDVQATYPFQILAIDNITSLWSCKGSLKLLLFVDLVLGDVIAKVIIYRTTQAVDENYEECGLRRFGASETISHDLEPVSCRTFSII